MLKSVLQFLALSCALAAVVSASPVIGAGAWSSWPNVNNDGVPFWDQPSGDGGACNVGFFLAGGFTNCGSLQNGTPPGGMNLGGANLEYYSNNNAITPFLLAAGQWTFRLEGRIAGSPTFEVGYFYPLSVPPTNYPLFTQLNWVGNTATVNAADVIALYLSDNPYFFRSDANPLGVAAFRNTQLPNVFYFGFEDRPRGDWDMNDVVLSAHYVPEPGTYALIGAGLLALGLLRRRMR
jgi:hypothetical protein